MEARNTNSGFGMQGRIDTRVHDAATLQDAVDDYDSLSDEEKLELTREVEPEYEDTFYNVTTDRLHQYFVDNLEPDQTGAKDNVNITWIGFGTGGATAPSTSDTDLTTRVFEKQVTDTIDNGKELLVSTFVDSSEANGNDLDELGLFTGDPANLANSEVFLANHASFAAVTKDNTKTVTFDVTLTFSDV